MLNIVGIDPGHGGPDPGASAHGIIESQFVFKFAQDLQETLKTAEYLSVLSRKEDEDPVFSARALRLRQTSLVFVLHMNADLGHQSGAIFFYDTFNTKSIHIAEKLNRFWPRELRRNRNGVLSVNSSKVQTSEHHWMSGVYNNIARYRQPAVFCEMFFATHSRDVALVRDPAIYTRMLGAFVRCLDNSEHLFF